MLVLSRQVGETVVIEDVVVTVIRVAEGYVEASLAKMSGGKATIVTLPQNEYVDICYEARVVYLFAKGPKVRLGFELPRWTAIRRGECLDS